MKKQILIIHSNMELGGAETSLLGLLDSIDYSKYEVSLFLYSHTGELMQFLNKNVKLISESKKYKALTTSIADDIKNRCFIVALLRCYAKIISKMSNGSLHLPHNYKQYFHKLCVRDLPRIKGKYDLAISFNDPHYIIGKKVDSKIKLSWFHTDASRIDFCEKFEKEMWEMSDYVLNVSENCKNEFDKVHSYLNNQSIVIENILSKYFLFNQSKKLQYEISAASSDSINLLSIGRFCEAKNFDNIPAICKLILEKGLNIKWYLIGYGTDEEIIRSKIKEFDMEDNVIILGKKINPYPYIKNCDLYVQPSRYEGKAVTVREAQMLCKPVVITQFATSSSQLKDGYDGIIVPMDNQGCADGIAKLLNNKVLMQQLSENCAENDYSNSQEINKIYEIIENS